MMLRYLMEKYHPLAAVLYGSHADGTANAESDYDVLLITESTECHDTAIVNGVQLDAWVYPRSGAESLTDGEAVIQLHDGVVLLDTDGLAAGLIARAREHAAGKAHLSDEEKRDLQAWCGKMARRARRGDAEGLYRWHWLLTDSLSIYCDVRDAFYFGPKKTLLRMEKEDPEGFARYGAALRDMAALDAWLTHLFKGK